MSGTRGKRIECIDAAKGLAILLVIVGHTVASGTFTRNIIFSFHIPLFFILSGYTFRPSSNWADFFYRLKKDAAHLLVPYVICGLIIALIKIFYRGLPAGAVAKDTAEALLWASGTGDGVHEKIGVLWFLASLFTARQIVNLVYTAYKNDLEHRAPYIIGMIAVLGLGIGMFDWNWLIFNLDVSMAASGYILAGMVLRDHLAELKKLDAWLFPLCLIIWMYLMKAFGYIEMSGRWYPELTLGVLESFCGSYCVIRFIQAVTFLRKPTAVLTYLGRNSLLLMCIHAVEDSTFSFWLNMDPTLAVAARLCGDLVLLVLLTTIWKSIRRKQMEN